MHHQGNADNTDNTDAAAALNLSTVSLSGLHDLLIHDYRALELDDQVFVVVVTDSKILLASTLAEPGAAWLVDEYVGHMRTLIAQAATVVVFAYSHQARAFAETLRQHGASQGWSIVHADTTGCRASVVPTWRLNTTSLSPAPGAGQESGADLDTQQHNSAEWWSASVQEQRWADLRTAHRILDADGEAALQPAHLQAVHEALQDPQTVTACLTWLDDTTIDLWRFLSATAPHHVAARAEALLTCAHHLRGETAQALSAVQRARQQVLNAHRAAPHHRGLLHTSTEVEQLHLQELLRVVELIITREAGVLFAALLVEELIAHRARVQDDLRHSARP